MLYHVKFHIDQQSLGFDERRIAVRDAEAQRAREIREEGRLHGLWRRADGGGAIFVIEAASHEALAAEMSALPLFPYLREMEITPVIEHDAFPLGRPG